MPSCSFSSSRCNSAAVSGRGWRSGPDNRKPLSSMRDLLMHSPGPIPTPVLSEADMVLCRGELGMLLFWGTGGGPIAEDVRREWEG